MCLALTPRHFSANSLAQLETIARVKITILGKTTATTTGIRIMSRTRFSSNSDPNPGSESSNGVSVPELRVFIRKKRLKETLQPNPLLRQKKPSVLPDIEEFAYKKASGSVSSKNSQTASGDLVAEAEVSPLVRPRGESPPNWENVLEGIRKMRSSEDAPVDTMGCEKAGSLLPPKFCVKVTIHGVNLLELKNSIMVLASGLKSGTGAIQRLLQNDLLTAEAIDKGNEATIKDLIYPV
ncbi:hypothetical protein TIFTF001_028510 [Ficus carica]|uniref:Uncharacterized protein n=1 Tax=Ficus carica TaxID=3494 RepID=A0AA88DQ39_FICCA|nr:hypothetical protein TIFTF001_028510 [Ficus carica]